MNDVDELFQMLQIVLQQQMRLQYFLINKHIAYM